MDSLSCLLYTSEPLTSLVRGSFRKELSVSDFRLGVKAAVPTALGYVATVSYTHLHGTTMKCHTLHNLYVLLNTSQKLLNNSIVY